MHIATPSQNFSNSSPFKRSQTGPPRNHPLLFSIRSILVFVIQIWRVAQRVPLFTWWKWWGLCWHGPLRRGAGCLSMLQRWDQSHMASSVAAKLRSIHQVGGYMGKWLILLQFSSSEVCHQPGRPVDAEEILEWAHGKTRGYSTRHYEGLVVTRL